MTEEIRSYPPQLVPIEQLKPHPRNYRSHPADQVAHIKESLRRNGFYRNVVAAKDLTILAGHGVVVAAKELGVAEVPTIVLDVDPESPQAIKVLTGDNELSNLGEVDDRLLTELLKEVSDGDVSGLLGTGFDEKMLANLVFVTRPESEVPDEDAAAAWVGLPGFESSEEPYRLIVMAKGEAERDELVAKLGVTVSYRQGRAVSAWWPPKPKDDQLSKEYRTSEPEAEVAR